MTAQVTSGKLKLLRTADPIVDLRVLWFIPEAQEDFCVVGVVGVIIFDTCAPCVFTDVITVL